MVWHVTILFLSWTFAFIAEKIFPKAYYALHLSSHWLSYLFFRPVQLFFSIFLYLLALFIIRHITLFHAKIILGRGNFFNKKSIKSLVPLLLGLLILLFLLRRQLLPTLLPLGGMLIYDGYRAYGEFRRMKRLKSAFRPSLPK